MWELVELLFAHNADVGAQDKDKFFTVTFGIGRDRVSGFVRGAGFGHGFPAF